MRELLEQSSIQQERLSRFISQITADHLSRLSEPCYIPVYIKDYNELLKLTGLTEKELKDYIKSFYPKKLASEFILRDPHNNLLLFIMYYYLRKRNQVMFTYTMVYLGIKFYTNVYKNFFPTYCNPEIFKYTLDNLNKTHLIAREKTISNFIFYLAKEMIKQHQKDLTDFSDPDKISKFLYKYRHRINQTMRSFANLYYKFEKEGKSYKSPYESEQGEYVTPQAVERGQRIIEVITQKITIYKQVDNKAYDDAKKLTDTSSSLSRRIVSELSNLKHSDKIKTILDLFIRGIRSTNQLCGKDFYEYVRSLMAIKRTSQEVYFKQQIVELLEEILKDIGEFKTFSRLTPPTRFQSALFLSYYITIYTRNTVCGK